MYGRETNRIGLMQRRYRCLILTSILPLEKKGNQTIQIKLEIVHKNTTQSYRRRPIYGIPAALTTFSINKVKMNLAMDH